MHIFRQASRGRNDCFRPAAANHSGNRQAILDALDAWRGPGGIFGCLTLAPVMDITVQRDMAAIAHIDVDALRLHAGMALESVLDPAFDVVGMHLRLDRDAVDHAHHAGQLADGVFGGGALIMPVHLSR